MCSSGSMYYDEDDYQVDRIIEMAWEDRTPFEACLLYTSPSPRDRTRSRMPSSA